MKPFMPPALPTAPKPRSITVTLYEAAFQTRHLDFSDTLPGGFGWAAFELPSSGVSGYSNRLVAVTRNGQRQRVYLGNGIFYFIGDEARRPEPYTVEFTVIKGLTLLAFTPAMHQLARRVANREEHEAYSKRNASFLDWLGQLAQHDLLQQTRIL